MDVKIAYCLIGANLTLKDITPAWVCHWGNYEIQVLLQGLCSDARYHRSSERDGVNRVTCILDPRGITAAWEYWPDEFSVLVAEADRRGLAW